MNIIIAGGGRVGSALIKQLSAEGHDITLIDQDQSVLDDRVARFDIMALQGNCASMPTLLQAGVKEAQLLIATAGDDEINLLCCTTAHGLNPNIHTIARIRNPDYTDQIYEMRDTFGLSMAVNPEKRAAKEIHQLLQFPGFLRRDIFARGRAEIVELRVDENSKLKGKALMDMAGIVRCRTLVCAVLRNGEAIVPSGVFVLQEGDRVFVTAPTENLTILLKNLGILTKKVRRVMICGGSKISFYLAKRLKKSGIQVQLIEAKKERAETLYAQLPGVEIIHGDASDMELLSSVGLGSCDAFVSLTGSDEMNIILSLYATNQGVSQTITKLSQVEDRSIIDGLRLDRVIYPKVLSRNAIVRYVRAMQNQTGAAISVHAIADGQVEAMEFLVTDDTLHCNVPLKKLNIQPNVLIACIIHGSQTEIPNGDSTFQCGDTLVVVTSGRGVLKQINDIFL